MKHAPSIVSSLLAALVLGCANNNAGDRDPAPTTSTTAVHSSSSAASGSDATPGDTTPTTAIVTSTGPGGDESTDEGSNFLDPPDLPPMAPLCDQWAQDCPEGQKCAPYSTNGGIWDALKCVPVTGSDQPGEPCSSEGVISGRDSCIEGAICWDVGADAIGTCVAMCKGTPEAPSCDLPIVCTTADDGTLALCLPPCDPLVQDCNEPGEACYLFIDGLICLNDSSGDEGQANDPCWGSGSCDPGLLCAEGALVGAGCPPDEARCCTPFCQYPGGACPNPDQQCMQYYDTMQFPPGDPWLDVGVCGIPG